MGFGTRNAGGERIFEFGDAVGMVVCNTFFKKEDSKLITYQSGENRRYVTKPGGNLNRLKKINRCDQEGSIHSCDDSPSYKSSRLQSESG